MTKELSAVEPMLTIHLPASVLQEMQKEMVGKLTQIIHQIDVDRRMLQVDPRASLAARLRRNLQRRAMLAVAYNNINLVLAADALKHTNTEGTQS